MVYKVHINTLIRCIFKEKTISNYSLTGDMTSSGTYTSVSDGYGKGGLDLTFTETSPGSETYTGYYDSEDKIISAVFAYGGMSPVIFSKQ